MTFTSVFGKPVQNGIRIFHQDDLPAILAQSRLAVGNLPVPQFSLSLSADGVAVRADIVRDPQES